MNQIYVFIAILCFSLPVAVAEDGRQKAAQRIEFDEGLIEGVRNRGGDFSSVTTKDRNRRKDHLYQREFAFDRERDETLREMRYSQ